MLALEPEEIGGTLLEILDGSEVNFSQNQVAEPIFRTLGTPGWPEVCKAWTAVLRRRPGPAAESRRFQPFAEPRSNNEVLP
jgi:hypothetical protein